MYDIIVIIAAILAFAGVPIAYVLARQSRVSKPENKKAGVMLVIKDGLILAVSRRHNENAFGLPGGKFDSDAGDKTVLDTAIRETWEETGVDVVDASFIYERIELGDGPNGVDFHSTTYYAFTWVGEPASEEDGLVVKWATAQELTSSSAAFPDYNKNMLDIFRSQFPDVKLVGDDVAG